MVNLRRRKKTTIWIYYICKYNSLVVKCEKRDIEDSCIMIELEHLVVADRLNTDLC